MDVLFWTDTFWGWFTIYMLGTIPGFKLEDIMSSTWSVDRKGEIEKEWDGNYCPPALAMWFWPVVLFWYIFVWNGGKFNSSRIMQAKPPKEIAEKSEQIKHTNRCKELGVDP